MTKDNQPQRRDDDGGRSGWDFLNKPLNSEPGDQPHSGTPNRSHDLHWDIGLLVLIAFGAAFAVLSVLGILGVPHVVLSLVSGGLTVVGGSLIRRRYVTLRQRAQRAADDPTTHDPRQQLGVAALWSYRAPERATDLVQPAGTGWVLWSPRSAADKPREIGAYLVVGVLALGVLVGGSLARYKTGSVVVWELAIGALALGAAAVIIAVSRAHARTIVAPAGTAGARDRSRPRRTAIATTALPVCGAEAAEAAAALHALENTASRTGVIEPGWWLALYGPLFSLVRTLDDIPPAASSTADVPGDSDELAQEYGHDLAVIAQRLRRLDARLAEQSGSTSVREPDRAGEPGTQTGETEAGRIALAAVEQAYSYLATHAGQP